jgi:hypothetical protein
MNIKHQNLKKQFFELCGEMYKEDARGELLFRSFGDDSACIVTLLGFTIQTTNTRNMEYIN